MLHWFLVHFCQKIIHWHTHICSCSCSLTELKLLLMIMTRVPSQCFFCWARFCTRSCVIILTNGCCHLKSSLFQRTVKKEPRAKARRLNYYKVLWWSCHFRHLVLLLRFWPLIELFHIYCNFVNLLMSVFQKIHVANWITVWLRKMSNNLTTQSESESKRGPKVKACYT